MDWKDLEKMTVLKLREEALKYPEIEAVHGKNKEQLMDEIAKILGIEKPPAFHREYRSHQVRFETQNPRAEDRAGKTTSAARPSKAPRRPPRVA